MKLVIEMSEDDYRKVQDGRASVSMMRKAIANGTPLPKGHGRLIDADAVLVEPFGNTYKDIDIAETIIEADNVGSKEQQYLEDAQEALSRIFDRCEEIDLQSGYDMLEDIQFVRGFINKHKPQKSEE